MPLEIVQHSAAPIGARLIPASRGWAQIHPRYRESFAAARLMTAESLLALPGEIVSGHPDRHVMRVELPGGIAAYLKRQHRVGWRERLKQKLDGCGWSSRCVREANVLKQLEREGLPCPQWIAFGEDGDGRAFLLVEELTGFRQLSTMLRDSALTQVDRKRLAERLGESIAELHAAGFLTRDLSAKHVFVDPATFAITLIDWQNARHVEQLGERERLQYLAALNASLPDMFADGRDRLRVLWACERVYRRSWNTRARFSEPAREIARLSLGLRNRRSIRDQREGINVDQRLVWVADEAVCAIPEIAAIWPKPAIAPPYYSCDPGTIQIQLADGRVATLVRGRSFAPFSRLLAAIRGKSWRSPGANIGRELFHKQRYGIPAPRLYAFGQRLTGPFTAEWFALYDGEFTTKAQRSHEEHKEEPNRVLKYLPTNERATL